MTLFEVGLNIQFGNKNKDYYPEHFNIVAECAMDAISGANNYALDQYKPRKITTLLLSVRPLQSIDLIY